MEKGYPAPALSSLELTYSLLTMVSCGDVAGALWKITVTGRIDMVSTSHTLVLNAFSTSRHLSNALKSTDYQSNIRGHTGGNSGIQGCTGWLKILCSTFSRILCSFKSREHCVFETLSRGKSNLDFTILFQSKDMLYSNSSSH